MRAHCPTNLFAAISLAAALLASLGTAHADVLEGKVVGVTDGDTVTVLVDRREVKVRVAGIDAPEKKQAFGQRSKEHLSDCAFGKAVLIEWSKTDRYGRTIGKVLADDVDCGLRQVQDGLAWHYKAYAKEQTVTDRAAYTQAESQAMALKAGLWSDPHPIPPWDFRNAPSVNHRD
jgi:endonuclease YncB( thermonuclease family)